MFGKKFGTRLSSVVCVWLIDLGHRSSIRKIREVKTSRSNEDKLEKQRQYAIMLLPSCRASFGGCDSMFWFITPCNIS
jgi:hypothetical protein